jgi:hypothetical protein
MGRTEDFESSLQVLRGFGTDISIEANEIKVLNVLPVHFLHFNQIHIIQKLIVNQVVHFFFFFSFF